MLNVVEDRNKIDILVEHIQSLIENKSLPFSPAKKGSVSGAAMAAAADLLRTTGGHVIAFVSNACFDGVGSSEELTEHKLHDENKSPFI